MHGWVPVKWWLYTFATFNLWVNTNLHHMTAKSYCSWALKPFCDDCSDFSWVEIINIKGQKLKHCTSNNYNIMCAMQLRYGVLLSALLSINSKMASWRLCLLPLLHFAILQLCCNLYYFVIFNLYYTMQFFRNL